MNDAVGTHDVEALVERAAARLQGRLSEEPLIGEPAVAAAAARLWNGEVTARPAMLVRCRTSAEVQAVVQVAGEVGLPFSVLGGGHDWNGAAVRAGALVIDLAPLRQVEIRPDRVGVIGGGATSSDLLEAARAHGLGAVLGTVGSVGAVGLILGGGLSPLSGVSGLGVDNVLAAEVVLADSRVVRADAASEPELFWALRGGGGNFGVVTRLEVRLPPIPEVTTGMIAFAWSQARDVLRGWHAVTAVDDALDVMFGAMASPDGPLLYTVPLWSGDADAGQAQIDRARALGDPVLDNVARIALADSVHTLDELFPAGGHYRLSSRTLPADLSDGAIEAFVAAAELMPPLCFLNVHHLHGAVTRVPVTDTAYAYRDEHVVVEILGSWPDGDGSDGRAVRDWVTQAERLIDPHALPGGWTNLMARGDARARDAYGPNTTRLLAAKKQYDPNGVFDAIPIPG